MRKQRLRVERGLPGFWLLFTIDATTGDYLRTVSSAATGEEASATAGVIADHWSTFAEASA